MPSGLHTTTRKTLTFKNTNQPREKTMQKKISLSKAQVVPALILRASLAAATKANKTAKVAVESAKQDREPFLQVCKEAVALDDTDNAVFVDPEGEVILTASKSRGSLTMDDKQMARFLKEVLGDEVDPEDVQAFVDALVETKLFQAMEFSHTKMPADIKKAFTSTTSVAYGARTWKAV